MRYLVLGLAAAVLLGAWLVMRGDAVKELDPEAPIPTGVEATAAEAGTGIARDPAAAVDPLAAPSLQSGSDLELAATQHEILVLDQDRRPIAGISYARAYSLEPDSRWSGSDRLTEADGKGRLEGFAPGDQRSCYVQVGFHGPEATGALLSPGVDLSRPVEIVLPPYAAIRVEAAPELSEFVNAGLRLDTPDHEFHGIAGTVARLEGGTALIHFVGLGQNWIVSLRPETGGGSLQRRIRGPETAGEEVVVRFEAGSDPILTGILAAEDGTILSGVECHYSIRGEQLDAGSNLQTDVNGRFTVPLNERHLSATPRELEFRRYLPGNGGGFGSHTEDPASAARTALPQPLPRAEVDLGTLQFAPEPVLASGIVREKGGGPVEGANLVVDELIYTSPQGEENWNHQNELLRAKSAADGTFTLYGPKPEPAIRLRTHTRDHLPVPPLLLRYGETGIEIELSRGGGFEGVIQWAAGGTLLGLEFGLQMAGGQLLRGGSIDGGTYKMKVRGAAPGTYDLVGRLDKEETEFLRLPGIVIRPGEVSTDPRVHPLDLDPFLELLTVAPRGPDGKLPPKCWIHRLREDGGDGGNTNYDAQGVQRLPILAGASADLLIESQGFRSLYLPGSRGTLEPRMEPVFTVTIRLRGSQALANAQGAYTLQAEPAADAHLPWLLVNHAKQQVQVQSNRSAPMTALVLGPWDVSLIVTRSNPRGGTLTETVPIGRIEIGAGDAERVYELDVPELPD